MRTTRAFPIDFPGRTAHDSASVRAMSATAASVGQASPNSHSTPTRDPPGAIALSGLLTLLLGGLLLQDGESLRAVVLVEWRELLFWATLITLLSFLPIPVEYGSRLTLDDPLLLAMALLYPPEVAAFVAFLASCDVREISREIAFSRALFNRAQIAVSVYLAGAAFRSVTGGNLDPWPIAALGTGAAVAAEYLANIFLVSLHTRAMWRLDLRSALGRLKVGNASQFLATHLGYGALALVISHLFRDVGAWSVAAFLVPILVARQMLMRGQAINALTQKLRSRDRLLEKLSDRILDERRDERQRVAGDLHDDVLQALTKLYLSACILEKQQGSLGPATDDLKEVVRASETSIDSLRAFIRDLKESSTGWGGLIPTLHGLVRDLRLEWKTKIQLTLPNSLDLEPATQLVAYQFVREALTNSLKHSHASLITVSAQVEERELTVRVQDDGVGFVLETVDSSIHFGLGIMKERVQKSGGRANIQSAPNQGTTAQAWFPLKPT
jgi:signal transduction histidine kinase